jgi:hypothetical protein
MGYWYSLGFQKITGIPYEKIGCKECHATCESCHLTQRDETTYTYEMETAAQMNATCLKCHGREKMALFIVAKMQIPDVHFSKGMTCMDCHSSVEIHGLKFKEDGTPYNSYREPGFLEASCEGCHLQGREVPGVGVAPKPPENVTEHQVHWYGMHNVHCTACHVATVQTCYSCHFDGALKGVPHSKLFTPLTGWVFLVKYRDMVYSANMMAITYEGKDAGFVIWAPFFSHIVVKEGRHCNECHSTPVVKDLAEDGKITLTWWDDGKGLQWLGLQAIQSGSKKGVIVPLVEGAHYEMVFVKKVNYETGEIAPFKVLVFTPSDKELPEIGYATVIAYGKPLTMEDLQKLAKG